MIWRDAVIDALGRYTARNQTDIIERQRLISEELDAIISATGSRGETPAQTLSRELQALKGSLLAFLGDGRYLFLPFKRDITTLPLEASDETFDDVILANKVDFPDVEAWDEVRWQRVRRGQAALRKWTLLHYGGQCALCDIADDGFLIASHVIRWADRADTRGDLRNVMCLCRFHDPLFEQGYLSLTDSFEVIKKRQPKQTLLADVLDRTTTFKSPLVAPPLAEYLARHRKDRGF